MPQLNWTYYSLAGTRHLIEMYHGDDSGHLILFVNGEIIKIVFSQVEDTTHSFIIDQQMIEFKMTKSGENFEYEVTPQTRESMGLKTKKEPTFSKHFWIPLIFLLVILNLVFYLIKSLKGIG